MLIPFRGQTSLIISLSLPFGNVLAVKMLPKGKVLDVAGYNILILHYFISGIELAVTFCKTRSAMVLGQGRVLLKDEACSLILTSFADG